MWRWEQDLTASRQIRLGVVPAVVIVPYYVEARRLGDSGEHKETEKNCSLVCE